MACATGTTFRLDGTTSAGITSTETTNDVCTAANLLDRLHREFTEQYVASAATGATAITDSLKNNPTFHLRQQPTLTGFNGESAGSTVNRYYSITTTTPRVDASYNGMMNAIMKGCMTPPIPILIPRHPGNQVLPIRRRLKDYTVYKI